MAETWPVNPYCDWKVHPNNTYVKQKFTVNPETGLPLWGNTIKGKKVDKSSVSKNMNAYASLLSQHCEETPGRGPYIFKDPKDGPIVAAQSLRDFASYASANRFNLKNCSYKPIGDAVNVEMEERNARCGKLSGKEASYVQDAKTETRILASKDIHTLDAFNRHPDYVFDPKKCKMNRLEYRAKVAAFELENEGKCQIHDQMTDKHTHPDNTDYATDEIYKNKHPFSSKNCYTSKSRLKNLIDEIVADYGARCLAEKGGFNTGGYQRADGQFKSVKHFKDTQKYDSKRCIKNGPEISRLCEIKIKDFARQCVAVDNNNEEDYERPWNLSPNIIPNPDESLPFLNTAKFERSKCKFSYTKLIQELKDIIIDRGITCSQHPSGDYADVYQVDPTLLTESSLIQQGIKSSSDFEIKYPHNYGKCQMSAKFREKVDETLKSLGNQCASTGPYTNDYRYVPEEDIRDLGKIPKFSEKYCVADVTKIEGSAQKHARALAKKCLDKKPEMYEDSYEPPPRLLNKDDLNVYLAVAFDIKKCAVDHDRVSDDIDRVIAEYAKICAKEEGNEDDYPEVKKEIKMGYKSGAEYARRNVHNPELCVTDMQKLEDALKKEIGDRKGKCEKISDIYGHYNFHLDPDVSRYKSLKFFNSSPDTDFKESLCEIDEAKLRARISRKLEQYGKDCKSRTEGTFLDAYDSEVDQITDLRSLQDLEKFFDVSKCKRDAKTISEDIDRVIAERAAKCVDIDENNENVYPELTLAEKLPYASAAQYEKEVAFDETLCKIDKGRLEKQLRKKIADRGVECADHKDQIYTGDYRFELPTDFSKYKSVANFSDVEKFDTSLCTIDADKMRNRIDKRLQSNRSRCKERTDGLYLDDYESHGADELMISAIRNIEDLMKFEQWWEATKCKRDDAAISDQIDAVIARYANDCVEEDANNKHAYPDVSAGDRSQYSSGEDFAAKNNFDTALCEIDEKRLEDQLTKEMTDRKKRCSDHADGIYQDDYAMQLDPDVTKYQSVDNFRTAEETRFNIDMCVIDEQKVRDRINKSLIGYGIRCKARTDGRFLEQYDDKGPVVKHISDLLDFERSYTDSKCRTNDQMISIEIDAALRGYADDCVRFNKYNKHEYRGIDAVQKKKFKSVEEFTNANGFADSNCSIDGPKLHKDLMAELEYRKNWCATPKNSGTVYTHDYDFGNGYTIPKVDDIASLAAIKSVKNFNEHVPLDERSCVVDTDGLRKGLDAEIDKRKDMCSKENGVMNLRDYQYDVPEDVSQINSIRHFNEDILPYSNLDCILDEDGIRKSIEAELHKRSIHCKDKGYSDAYRVVIPSNIKHIDEFNNRKDTMYDERKGCVVDHVLLRSQLAEEIQKRHSQCKGEGYVKYGREAPGDSQLESIGTIRRYKDENPLAEAECVVDSALVSADIGRVNSKRRDTCMERGFVGYDQPANTSPEKWRKPGTYNKGSTFIPDHHCTVDLEMDKYKRYFKHAPTPISCDRVKGTWSGSSINRRGRKETGQCWATPNDSLCGKIPTAGVIQLGKERNTALIASSRSNCEKESGCAWADMTLYPECVTKTLRTKMEEKAIKEIPPPLSPNNPEKRVYDYFTHPGPDGTAPPKFSRLIGKEGENRCDAADAKTIHNPHVPRLCGGDIVEVENEFLSTLGKAKKVFTLPQTVVRFAMRDVALRPNGTGGNRGVLVWHSTGSGKLNCGAACMEAFWDTDKTIVFASTIENNRTNPSSKYHESLVHFFPRFNNPSLTEKENIKMVDTAYTKRGIKHYSFAELSNRIRGERVDKKSDPNINVNKSVIIIDEIQNLFAARAGQDEHHKYLEGVISDPVKSKDMKIVILTATPGDNAEEAVRLLNLVRDPMKPKIVAPTTVADLPVFKASIRGLISYFDASGDKTKFPELRQAEHRFPMSETHFRKYCEKHHETKDEALKTTMLRRYSNMPYNEYPSEEYKNMFDYSAKLEGLLNVIKAHPTENHYVYSAFFRHQKGTSSHGVRAIGAQLENVLHYKQISFGKCKDVYDQLIRNVPYGGLDPNQKRFVVVTDRDLVPDNFKFGNDHEQLELDADLKSANNNLCWILKIFNSPENKDGKLIHVFIASQKYNESNDFKAIRHVHIFEPLVSMVSDAQTIGRGRRNCSHSSLDQKLGQWVVNVHRYFSDRPSTLQVQVVDTVGIQAKLDAIIVQIGNLKKKDPENRKRLHEEKKKYDSALKKDKKVNSDNIVIIDQKIYDDAKRRMVVMQLTTQAMKESALDCSLLSEFHNASIPVADRFTCTAWGK